MEITLAQIAICALTVAGVVASFGAAFYWWKASIEPVPEVEPLAGILPASTGLGRPLGGGQAVIVDTGPLNDLAKALRAQGALNKRGAACAATAALFQGAAFAAQALLG